MLPKSALRSGKARVHPKLLLDLLLRQQRRPIYRRHRSARPIHHQGVKRHLDRDMRRVEAVQTRWLCLQTAETDEARSRAPRRSPRRRRHGQPASPERPHHHAITDLERFIRGRSTTCSAPGARRRRPNRSPQHTADAARLHSAAAAVGARPSVLTVAGMLRWERGRRLACGGGSIWDRRTGGRS